MDFVWNTSGYCTFNCLFLYLLIATIFYFRFYFNLVQASGAVVPQKLHMSIEGCEAFDNSSSISPFIEHDESDVFPLYRLSFMWINPSEYKYRDIEHGIHFLQFKNHFSNHISHFSVGILSVLIVGMIASYISGPEDLKKINPDLISPVIHRFLPSECFVNHENNRCASTEPTTELFTLKIGECSRPDDCHQIHSVENS